MSIEAGYQLRSSVAMPVLGSVRENWVGIAFGVLAIVVVITAIGLALPNILTIGFAFEKNYNEGWNVYNTQRVLGHEIIYDRSYLRINNYPILSFLMVEQLYEVTHDLLLAGRVAALLSFAAIGILAASVTRRLGGDRVDAIFGGGCALGFCFLIAPGWVAIDDPQSLAEALSLAGLAAYLSGGKTSKGVLLAALMVTASGFTKHNLLAIPVAITLDLALQSRRRLAIWIAACSSCTAGFLVMTQLAAGGDFLDHLLLPRAYLWFNVSYHAMKFLREFKFPLLVIVCLSPILFTRERRVLAIYGIVSITAGALLAGGDGTSFNMLQDAAVFAAIAAGVGFGELRRRLAARHLVVQLAAVVGIVLLPLPILGKLSIASGNLTHPGAILEAARANGQSFTDDVAFVAARPGNAICESLLLCYEAGAPFTLDPFNSRQNILSGRLDQANLIHGIAAKAFPVIQLRGEICDDKASAECHILHYPRKFNRFTDDFLYAVARYYRPERRSAAGIFYVPKDPTVERPGVAALDSLMPPPQPAAVR